MPVLIEPAAGVMIVAIGCCAFARGVVIRSSTRMHAQRMAGDLLECGCIVIDRLVNKSDNSCKADGKGNSKCRMHSAVYDGERCVRTSWTSERLGAGGWIAKHYGMATIKRADIAVPERRVAYA